LNKSGKLGRKSHNQKVPAKPQLSKLYVSPGEKREKKECFAFNTSKSPFLFFLCAMLLQNSILICFYVLQSARKTCLKRTHFYPLKLIHKSGKKGPKKGFFIRFSGLEKLDLQSPEKGFFQVRKRPKKVQELSAWKKIFSPKKRMTVTG
jgi:hypothetical protein